METNERIVLIDDTTMNKKTCIYDKNAFYIIQINIFSCILGD